MNKSLVVLLVTISLAALAQAMDPKYTGVRFINYNLDLMTTVPITCNVYDPNSSFKKELKLSRFVGYQITTDIKNSRDTAKLAYSCHINGKDTKSKTLTITKDRNICVMIVIYPKPLTKHLIYEDDCYKVNPKRFPK